MLFEFRSIKCNYECTGEGKDIILLHGWGQDLEVFRMVSDYLKQHYKVWLIDLPGFGKSEEPNTAFSVDDYVDCLHQFIVKNEIHSPILMGHSFGGRISIKYAYKHKQCDSLILINSAGIKPKRGFVYYMKIYVYKIGKRILKLLRMKRVMNYLKQKVGSLDYLNASIVMRQTLINVVNEDLTPYLKDVLPPSLLIWGEHDKITPLKDGKLMDSLIPDSGLVIMENAGHHCYLDNLHFFLVVVMKFLEDHR